MPSFFKKILKNQHNLKRGLRFYRDIRPLYKPISIHSDGYKYVGNPGLMENSFEPEETEFFRKHIGEFDVFVNVGANVGKYACIALSQSTYSILLEPKCENMLQLVKNIETNGWSEKAEVYPVAASNKNDVLKLYGSGTGASLISGWANIEEDFCELVPCVPLDTIIGKRLNGKATFLVVDVEGAELFVLQGAKSLIEQEPKPVWMIEICIDEHQPDEGSINSKMLPTFELMFKSGYRAWTLDKAVDEITIETLKKIEHTGSNNLATHNFLFLDAKKYSKADVVSFLNENKSLVD